MRSKHIKMQPSEKQPNRKGKKGNKVALPNRPGNVCNIILHSKWFAAAAGHLDEEDDAECKTEKEVETMPKKRKAEKQSL